MNSYVHKTVDNKIGDKVIKA